MNLVYRPVNNDDINELRFIAEADSRIPLECDPSYTFNDSSIHTRLEFYKDKISNEDFFEVVADSDSIVAFHIVKKTPYPPNFFIGNIISLWVHPNYRKQGLAAQLKSRAESWSKQDGMIFMQTNVHKDNSRMLKMNEDNGYEATYINLRKRL